MNIFPGFNHSEPLRDTPLDSRDVSRECPPTVREAGSGRVPAPPKRSLRVLCIDDDEMVLESVKDCLRYFGHQAGAASSGKCGVELFRTALLKNEPYDVVITDMNMPGINGYVVAQMIKTESPDTPVILMTGAGNTTMDTGSLSASVDISVHKPLGLQALNDLLFQMARPA
ncbi:MAG: response regulator [Verrucomicrobiia bacterium]